MITTASATTVPASAIEDSSTTSGPTTIPSAATDSASAGTDPTPADDTTTSPPCDFAGSLDDVLYEFPMVMSGEVGADIRTGGHPCFERVVIELAWMTFIDGEGQLVGYVGPTDIVPANVSAIEELRLLDNSEGVHTWAVGLDHRRAFHVDTLADPTRMVVDISN